MPPLDESESTVPAKTSRSRAPRQVFAIGEVLNETYEIRAVIGEGGMGQVYEADDLVLHRRVAIKAGWPERGRQWLRMEAAALAAVRHPAMVAVHHLATHHDTDYVVMERIYGVALSTHIARRRAATDRFTIDEIVDVLMAIADGLSAVHRAGLAHRDVKPANVMLAPGNRVVVMDFGLSVAEAQPPSGNAPAGTPTYMAPEAIMSDTRAGERFGVDLYALGVMAYEMLTLHPPFGGKTTVDVWSAHLQQEAPDPRQHRDDVPPQLAELIASLMAKTPDDRPESMESVAVRLRGLRGSERTSRARAAPLSVLVVDDDPDMTALLRALIRRAVPDATITTAHNADQAIKHVHKQRPELLLLDLRMPSMNGIELAMYLRGTHLADGATIIAVSALAKDDDVALLRALGITQFIPKGPELDKRLVTALRELDQRRAQ